MSDIVAERFRSRMVLSPLVIACLGATWFIWGSGYLAIKVTLTGFPPFLMMGLRFLAAGVLLMIWMLRRRAPMPTLRQWLNAALIGTLMLGGGMGMIAAERKRYFASTVSDYFRCPKRMFSISTYDAGRQR